MHQKDHLPFIPDATIVNNLVSGTKGFLDIKGIYFQSGDYDTTGNGIVYFDTTGKQVGAAGTAAGISTSNFVLTTNASWHTKMDRYSRWRDFLTYDKF